MSEQTPIIEQTQSQTENLRDKATNTLIDIAHGVSEMMAPRRTSITGGEYNSKNRTYTTKDQENGIITEYHLTPLGFLQQDNSGMDMVMTRYYKEATSDKGDKIRAEVVKDTKTGEWRTPTIVDRTMAVVAGMKTKGAVESIKQPDGTITTVFRLVENDPISKIISKN